MSELPQPLQRWTQALALFPRHLALELGAWFPRLLAALGPMRARAAEGSDEPDGFDGLSRRGPYERLLTTEWALADEHPDEFLRRATSGEHTFFQLAFRAPAGKRRCLVLLDSGPSQLGTPRLAHLAALAVLERRAADARSELLWGVLQQPPGRFLTGLNPSAVEHWVRARTPHEPTPEDLAGWRDAFGRTGPDDEVWVLGSSRAARFEDTNLLLVREAPGALALEVKPRTGARREVLLPLPSDEVCTQLIRDPLKREAPIDRLAGPSTNLLFVAGGSRLLYGTAGGSLVTHIIPGAPGFASAPMWWSPPKDEQVVAAGWDKGLLLVTLRAGALRVNWFNKRGGLRGQGAWHLPIGETVRDPVSHVPSVLGACVHVPAWHVATSGGQLAVFQPDRTYRVAKRNVVAVGVHKGHLLTVERTNGEAHLELVPTAPGAAVKFPAPGRAVEQRGVKVQLFHPAKERVLGVFQDLAADSGRITVRGVMPTAPVVFGYDNAGTKNVAVGLQLPDGRWRVVRLRDNVDCADIAVPEKASVYGVANLENDQPALLAVASDGCTIGLYGGKTATKIVRAASRIVRLTVSPFTSHFAYEDEGGLLCVYSLRRSQVVLRLLSMGGKR
ncbi:MAG: hypothetical protein JNK82_29925 [Myxococcaceae bacterium]|nr:hypothetical protein [Myxococcaceae bacterium]